MNMTHLVNDQDKHWNVAIIKSCYTVLECCRYLVRQIYLIFFFVFPAVDVIKKLNRPNVKLQFVSLWFSFGIKLTRLKIKNKSYLKLNGKHVNKEKYI